MSMFSSIAREDAYEEIVSRCNKAKGEMLINYTAKDCVKIMDEIIKEFEEKRKEAKAGY